MPWREGGREGDRTLLTPPLYTVGWLQKHKEVEKRNASSKPKRKKKSCTQETPNLSTDADSSTDIFISAGVKKGADSLFLFC